MRHSPHKSVIVLPASCPARPTEIAHILFLDLVEFSKLPTDRQSESVAQLQDLVLGLGLVRAARAAAEVLCLPTGDGIALVFFQNPLAPAECAVAVAGELQKRLPHLRLRMGIHSGPVQRLRDVNGSQNVAGMGINLAQRVMNCGDAGHILLSKAAADTLLELSDWAPFLRDLGEFRVKHDVRLRLYSLVRDDAGNAHDPSRRRSMVRKSLIRSIAATVAVAGLLIAGVTNWPSIRDSLAGFPIKRYVAVLPFENASGNPADGALCDGLAEVMSSSLAKAGVGDQALWVAPASDVRRYGVKTIADASRMLGATLAIAGRLERRGEAMHLTLRLIDVARRRDLGSKNIQGQATRLDELSDSATHELAKLTGVSLAMQAAMKGPGNGSAYEHYLEGEGSLHRFDGPQAVNRAIASFQKAIQLDPSFSRAVAGLAEAYLARYGETKDPQWLALADEQARRAASLQPGAHVHLTLGLIERETGHPEAAIAQFRRALEIEPANIEALRNLATAYELSGRKSEAEAAYKSAVRARPAYWPAHSSLAAFYTNTGQYEKAESAFQMVVQLAPRNQLGFRNLGGLYLLIGRKDEAAAMLRKSLEIRPTAAAYSNLGAALFGAKRYREAAEAVQQAVRLSDKDAMLQYNLADTLWLVDGRREEALAVYRRAADLARMQLTVNPNDARLASTLAICLARLGETKAAQEAVRRSMRLAPANPAIRFKAARVLAITGQPAEAIRALDEALAMRYPQQDAGQYPELAALQRGRY